MEQVERAREFAEQMHAGQLYGPGEPYTKHLSDVVEVLKFYGFGYEESLLAAAWLHDVLEDTPATFSQLWGRGFSATTCNLVDTVTDAPGKTRRERHQRTYPVIGESSLAITLKLADRIANVRTCVEKSDPKLEMYRKEYADFQNFLRKPSYKEHVPMWDELDRLLIFVGGAK